MVGQWKLLIYRTGRFTDEWRRMRSLAPHAQEVKNERSTSGIFYDLLATFLISTLVKTDDNKSGPSVGKDNS